MFESLFPPITQYEIEKLRDCNLPKHARNKIERKISRIFPFDFDDCVEQYQPHFEKCVDGYALRIQCKNAEIKTNEKYLLVHFEENKESKNSKFHSDHTMEYTIPADADSAHISAEDKDGYIEIFVPFKKTKSKDSEFRKIDIQQ